MQIDCVVEKLSYPIYSFILNAAWPKSIIFTGCILVLINCASISCQIVPSLGPYSMQIRWFDSFGSMDHQSSVSHWKVTNWASFHYLLFFLIVQLQITIELRDQSPWAFLSLSFVIVGLPAFLISWHPPTWPNVLSFFPLLPMGNLSQSSQAS